MSLMPIQGYSPNRQDYIDDPDTFNFRMPTLRSTRPRPMMSSADIDIFGRPSVDNRGKFMRPVVGETPKLPMLTDTSAKELYPQIDGISAYPTKKSPVSDYLDFYKRGRRVPVDQPGGRPMPQPVLTPRPQPFQPQPASPRFGQVQQQPQFNQQGMQQMMQFMQQMMQMFSMMSGQGGQGGFGGGFNQRPPMFGGGYGGGMGGGFGQGGYQQFQQPQQRPMPRYPRMQNNYSQSPFGRY